MSNSPAESLQGLARVCIIAISGAVSGFFGVVVGHPLDTLKVRLQVGRDIKNLPLSYETALLLYRGIVPPIITTGLVQAINFPIYEYFKALYFREFKYDYYTCAFLGGATSGSIISTFTIPFSFVKVQQQISTTNNVYLTAKNMYNLHGISIFYRGFPCSYVCETIGRGVYLFSYEYIKHYFYKQSPDSNQKAVSVKIIAASSAGCISWLSIYPFDCVRARLQLDAGKLSYKNTIDCFQKVYKEGGIRIFFRGFNYTFIRAAPTAAVVLPVYEHLLDFFNVKM